MKGANDNRRAAWLAGAAAIMPVVFSALPSAPAEATTSRQFVPPSDPMVLTRTLRRPLPGGAEVLTRRSYEIRFVPEAGVYRVDGRLVGVEVDAPPSLQALALLEKRRPDDGMFPMRLDERGVFRPVGDAVQSDEVRQAGQGVGKQVETLPLDRFDRAQAKSFAKAFEERSVHTAWPEDLFNPAPGAREETRMIPLPNGARGTVKINVDVSKHGPSGILGTFTRRVTTDLDGSNRITEESWTLAAKG